MKKLLAIFLILTLLFSMMACGESSTEKEDEKDKAGANFNDLIKDEEKSKKITIDKTVLYDNGEITVTLTELNYERDDYQATLYFEIANNADYAIYIEADYIGFNDWCEDKSMDEYIAAGNTITKETLVVTDCKLIQTIELPLYCYNSENYETIFDFTTDPIVINTSAVDEEYKDEYKADGKVIFEDSNFRIVMLKWIKDGPVGSYIDVYIENLTNDLYYIACSNESVNGNSECTVYISYSDAIAGCKKGCRHIEAYLYDENGDTDHFTDAETITFKFHFTKANSQNEYYSPEITLNYE